MKRYIVPDVVQNQSLVSLSPGDTSHDAATLMAEKNIGAILIVESNKLCGIFTERDMTSRIVAKDLDPKKTLLKDVMTKNPLTLDPKDTAKHALETMKAKKFRHLPVVDKDKIVGMVSVRDLYDVIMKELQEDVEEREAFIFGKSYGGPS